jgi:tRNA(Arg) A34 adenosine deaminase TadA
MTRERGLAIARSQSKKSKYKVQVGCVIIKSGRVIGRGFNKVKPNVDPPAYAYSIHAEVDAVNSISSLKRLDRATVYVYREHKNGTPALSKPCSKCMSTLQSAGFKKIRWSK